MATGHSALTDLGRLAEIDASSFQQAVILWDRFHVIGQRRELGDTVVVAVKDLHKTLGDPLTRRLNLHLVPLPLGPNEDARLIRACGVESQFQPRVSAVGRTKAWLVLVCEPAVGGAATLAPATSTLEGGKALVLASECASLLTKLHAVDVHGVRFQREMVRTEDDRFFLDSFTHLLGHVGQPDPKLDVDALAEFIRELGDASTSAALDQAPSTAVELTERLRSLASASGLLQPDPTTDLPADPPFIGRSLAFTELRRGFDQAQIAQPTALIIKGPRGIGKSRLMGEFVSARARADDAIVLTGAWQQQSADSRGGLLNALEQLPQALARLNADERDDIRRRINRATRHLGAIVTRSAPSLGEVLRNVEELPRLELGEDFSRHTAVIADLLRSIGTSKRPLVLVLDNLETTDGSSAIVLKILAQRRPAHHTLLVMGLRTKSGGFVPDFEFESVELKPLTEPEISDLLTQTLPGSVVEAESLGQTLWSMSAGLPLVAWTNLRAWIDRGQLVRSPEDGSWRARKSLRDELDGGFEVEDVFGVVLAAAESGVRELALRVAVMGTEVDIESIHELDIANADAGLADLVKRGILANTTQGIQDAVRFPHDTIRELVLASSTEAELRAAHAAVANLVAARNAPVAQIAYHRDLALDPSGNTSPEAFDRLSRLHVDAGRERLAVYDLERARWHLERALEHSRDTEQRSQAAEGLADICLLSDDLDTAVSLYTAIIATSDGPRAVQMGAKAVAFLFSKAATIEARQLGNMALEVVSEPTPTSSFGKIAALFGAMLRSWFGPPKNMNIEVREGLCRLYPWMAIMSLVDDAAGVPMYLARGHWIAKGLDIGPASMVHSSEAAMWAAVGRFKHANELFALAFEISVKANDPWAQGWVKHMWAHVSLLPADRYEEGQDMLDDAIAAFRETGDVSISILSITFKGLFGRDREPAEMVLGWFDEAVATARRNGKFVGTATLEALRLHVLARQGRTDLEARLASLADQLDEADMAGVERLMARVHLAYAALESKSRKIAMAQVVAAKAILGELPGVPEYCAEIHIVTVLIYLEWPPATNEDEKVFRLAIRKSRAAAKQSLRLRAHGAMVEFKLALLAGNNETARALAAKIVADFDVHENLYIARQAHLGLSRLLKGENVLAAAEHDRVARNLGRRLGLQDQVLLSDFTEIEEETHALGLEADSRLNLDDSQYDIPAAGMLTSAVQKQPRRRRAAAPTLEAQTDVLEAWDLGSSSSPHTVLGQLLTPVRDAVSGSLGGDTLELRCVEPTLSVPIASADLQVVLINLLLACHDAVGSDSTITATLGVDETESHELVASKPFAGPGESPSPPPGRYLTIRVSAPSPASRVPVLNSFPTCERLVQTVKGFLNANVDRKQVVLQARIPLEQQPAPTASPPLRAVIVHPDADVRDALASALMEVGASCSVFEPEQFNSTKLEDSVLLLADGMSIEPVAVLEPLLNLRIVELVKHGAEPMSYEHQTLRVPFSETELEDILR
ncbi:large transcriptional regulator [Enhygromyxa salina]|uniref:Large transcriptional regulator n=1 Tax=Enhygromyxa salina TaxID=215803 RepID=A0A0C2D5T8_9BACT|nr:AAA family ATPase [Enhygromyxa salina]KIG15412.1 large transcriptional regulator [Enhygromyxa salina]